MKLLYTICIWLKYSLERVFCHSLHAFWRIVGKIPKVPSKAVLIIRPDGLGDMLVSLSSVRAIYDHFHAKGYRIVLLHSMGTLPIVSGSPFIDELLSVDVESVRSSLPKRLELFEKLARLRPEYAVNLLFLPKASRLDHQLAFFCGALHKFTIASRSFVRVDQYFEGYSDEARSFCRRLARKLLPNQAKSQALLSLWGNAWQGIYDICPVIQENADVYALENRLVDAVCNAHHEIELCPPKWMHQEDVALPERYYLVVPTANLVSKCWPEERFAKLIDELSRIFPDRTAVITGGKQDHSVVERILSLVSKNVKVLNLCGKTSLPQLFGLVENAEFIVGNDTGTAHVAGVLGKAQVVIVGGGHFGLYFPNRQYKKTLVAALQKPCFNCHYLCHGLANDRYPCIAEISVELVLQRIMSL